MSAAATHAPLASREHRACPHTPACPDRGRGARVVDARPEYGLSLLCNGGILFDTGRFLPPRPRDAAWEPVCVVVHAWGFRPTDLKIAIEQAYDAGRPNLWQIVHIVPSVGGPCPIERNAPLTVGYNADDGRVWAAYPAPDVAL